jgi:hypothetical protein
MGLYETEAFLIELMSRVWGNRCFAHGMQFLPSGDDISDHTNTEDIRFS